jgi:cytochrome c553
MKVLLPVVYLVLAVCASNARAADVAAGETRYTQNCVNCHGKSGKGMASFPAIIGRDVDYISDRLIQYRAREQVGPNSAIMMSLVGELTDDEIANLAAYISASFQ